MGRRRDHLDPRTQVLLAALRDPPFLYFRAANVILRAAITLFRAKLLPRAILPIALNLAKVLENRGRGHRARSRQRR
jgi:hypothetical protein